MRIRAAPAAELVELLCARVLAVGARPRASRSEAGGEVTSSIAVASVVAAHATAVVVAAEATAVGAAGGAARNFASGMTSCHCGQLKRLQGVITECSNIKNW
jgi:hypothetical protein